MLMYGLEQFVVATESLMESCDTHYPPPSYVGHLTVDCSASRRILLPLGSAVVVKNAAGPAHVPTRARKLKNPFEDGVVFAICAIWK
jgi:hypothetical protein